MQKFCHVNQERYDNNFLFLLGKVDGIFLSPTCVSAPDLLVPCFLSHIKWPAKDNPRSTLPSLLSQYLSAKKRFTFAFHASSPLSPKLLCPGKSLKAVCLYRLLVAIAAFPDHVNFPFVSSAIFSSHIHCFSKTQTTILCTIVLYICLTFPLRHPTNHRVLFPTASPTPLFLTSWPCECFSDVLGAPLILSHRSSISINIFLAPKYLHHLPHLVYLKWEQTVALSLKF